MAADGPNFGSQMVHAYISADCRPNCGISLYTLLHKNMRQCYVEVANILRGGCDANKFDGYICNTDLTFWAISSEARMKVQFLKNERTVVIPVLVIIKFICAPTQPIIHYNFVVPL